MYSIRTETEGNLREFTLKQIDFPNVLNFNNKKSDHKKKETASKTMEADTFCDGLHLHDTHTHTHRWREKENERKQALFVCKPSEAGKSLSAQQALAGRGWENASHRQKELKKLGLMEYVLN